MATQGSPRKNAARSNAADKLGAYASAHKQKRRWLTVLSVLAAAVICCTVYALTMPASTMTKADVAEQETAESADSSVEGSSEDQATSEGTTETEQTAEDATAQDETGSEPVSADDQADDQDATEQAASEAPATLPEGAQVPDGYTEQYTARDDANGFVVTVYAPSDAFSTDVTLKADLIPEGSEKYAAAQQALAADAGDDSDYGFAALDIRFVDADGNEVEPNGDVYVSIDATGLLPDAVDSESVTVEHHDEQGDGVSVETVADSADATAGVVDATNGNIQAAFEVGSFSTFTITWATVVGRLQPLRWPRIVR